MLTVDDALAVLQADSAFRVLRRFVPRDRYGAAGTSDLRVGLIVDCESTGKDTATDRITELAILPFEFDRDGHVYEVGAGQSWLNDPGMPIPPEVTALTGITDDMVRGQRIDVVAVQRALDSAVIVLAHHANFDRKLCERQVPDFAAKRWACSHEEVPWRDFGAPCAKLQHLLLEVCGEFGCAHRALDDCRVALHVLATAQREGRTALSYLLESARQPTTRIWATGAAFETKDVLKARDYRWCAPRKTWYLDARPADVDAEIDWLRGNTNVWQPRLETFDARDRYAVRAEPTYPIPALAARRSA